MRYFSGLLACVLLLGSAGQSIARTTDYAVLDANAWIDKSRKLPRPKLADIGVPRAAETVRLTKLDSFRPGGEDVVAQYISPDGEVFATLYIYRPTLPDARLAAIATGETIALRLGKQVRRLADAILPAGGRPGVAYRTMVDEATFPVEANTSLGFKASFASFLQAGNWIVKLRVTGPDERKTEVDAVGAAILAGLVFGKNEQPLPVAPYKVTECIDEALAPAARRVAGSADANIQLALMSIGTLTTVAGKAKEAARPHCIMRRAATGQAIWLVLRPVEGPAEPDIMLIGDAGTIVQVADLSPDGTKQPSVMIHGIGGAQVFGPFDRAPSADQLHGILAGQTDWLGEPVATLAYGSKGGLTVAINRVAITDRR